MVTAKQQNEFRIQLQKKACRRAEKRVEVLEDDVSWKEVRYQYYLVRSLRVSLTQALQH